MFKVKQRRLLPSVDYQHSVSQCSVFCSESAVTLHVFFSALLNLVYESTVHVILPTDEQQEVLPPRNQRRHYSPSLLL